MLELLRFKMTCMLPCTSSSLYPLLTSSLCARYLLNLKLDPQQTDLFIQQVPSFMALQSSEVTPRAVVLCSW